MIEPSRARAHLSSYITFRAAMVHLDQVAASDGKAQAAALREFRDYIEGLPDDDDRLRALSFDEDDIGINPAAGVEEFVDAVGKVDHSDFDRVLSDLVALILRGDRGEA